MGCRLGGAALVRLAADAVCGRPGDARGSTGLGRGDLRGKWTDWEAGLEYLFVIRSVQTRDRLGWIDLQPRAAGRGNVAYGVLPHGRRRGAATRGVVLATRYAFDVLGWFRLEIRTHADNLASRGVAVKAGYRLEGLLRSHGLMENHQPFIGQRFDEAIYGRLRTDD